MNSTRDFKARIRGLWQTVEMSNDLATRLTFWLGRSVLSGQNAPAQEMVFDEIEERVRDGASLTVAVSQVTDAAPRAGDFGVEIVSSMMAVVLAEGLKAFWAAYISELEKKSATKLADLTVDTVSRFFKSDLAGAQRAATLDQIHICIRNSADSRHLSPASVSSLVEASPDPAKLPDDIP